MSFTIKLYSDNGDRLRILTAKSFTVLRMEGGAEITLHQEYGGDDSRVDIKEPYPPATTPEQHQAQWPDRYQRAIIENELGKTTEMVYCSAAFAPRASRPEDEANCRAA